MVLTTTVFRRFPFIKKGTKSVPMYTEEKFINR